MYKRYYIFIIIFFLLAACANRKTISRQAEEKQVKFWKMIELQHSVERPLEIIVKNQEDWVRLCKMNVSRDPYIMPVNFNRYYIIYIAAYEMVEFDKVTRTPDSVKVYVNIIHPDRKAIAHGGWVTGYAIQIKKTGLPVEIIHTDKYLVDFS